MLPCKLLGGGPCLIMSLMEWSASRCLDKVYFVILNHYAVLCQSQAMTDATCQISFQQIPSDKFLGECIVTGESQ
jgi:hypothetical protein